LSRRVGEAPIETDVTVVLNESVQRSPDLAKAPSERSRMGGISGYLWMVGALIGVTASLLPGAIHEGWPWVLGLSAVAFLYGLGSVTGVLGWQYASINALAFGMVVTIPVVGLALYLTGGSISYIEPFLVCSLLYAAFFPPRWAWPLSIELILVAGTPLLYDPAATQNAFPSRYLAIVASFLAATWVMVGLKRRLVDAEALQRGFANRDPLTGVGNRRAFDAILRRELAARTKPAGRRDADDSPLALLILDIDDFKGINDAHGHQIGDVVLREAANRAQGILRSTDTLARIGGDEFAVIAPGAMGEGAQRMAEAIGTAVSLPESDRRGPVPSASVGWAVFPDDGGDFETLMQAADARMMKLKGNGGGVSPRAQPTRVRPAAG
jgi:diguanylate cyclase (GGDEF)-like protein